MFTQTMAAAKTKVDVCVCVSADKAGLYKPIQPWALFKPKLQRQCASTTLLTPPSHKSEPGAVVA